jgi:hypothetical protein
MADLFDKILPLALAFCGKQFDSNLFECSQIPLAERHWRYFLCVEFYLVTVRSRYRRTESRLLIKNVALMTVTDIYSSPI